MTKRFKLNLFAAAVIVAGGIGLTAATPASAAAVDGCSNMEAAIAENASECWDMGGSRMSYSGSCSSTGYTLSTTCYL